MTIKSRHTIPKRFSTEVVSIVCSAGTSTRKRLCSGEKGILCYRCVSREERKGWGGAGEDEEKEEGARG